MSSIPTSLVFVVLAAAWLAVLVPMFARRRHQVPETDEGGAGFRVLRRAITRRPNFRRTAVELEDEFDDAGHENDEFFSAPGVAEHVVELVDDDDDEQPTRELYLRSNAPVADVGEYTEASTSRNAAVAAVSERRLTSTRRLEHVGGSRPFRNADSSEADRPESHDGDGNGSHVFVPSQHDNRPAYDESDYDETEYSETESDRAEFDEAEFDEAEFDDPEFDEPDYNPANAAQPEYDEPEFDDSRYRPVPIRHGRGGFDPDAAEATRAYRFARRRRVTLVLVVLLIAFSAAANLIKPALWAGAAVSAVLLVGYLAYLNRTVRIEKDIRRRRQARLARARQIRPEYHPRPAEATAASHVPPVNYHPGRTVVDLDDDDPSFEELEHYQPITYRRAAG